jgi:hypothetical protein
MNVAELIAQLQKMPQDAMVVFPYEDYEAVTKVELKSIRKNTKHRSVMGTYVRANDISAGPDSPVLPAVCVGW